jgi:hypothetical protein
MTQDEKRITEAFRRSGLAFQGYTLQRALAIKPIRIALECAVKAEAKGKPAPIQPALSL